MDKDRAVGSHLHESGLHAGKHAADEAEVDVPDGGFDAEPLDRRLDGLAVFQHDGPGLAAIRAEENLPVHGWEESAVAHAG